MIARRGMLLAKNAGMSKKINVNPKFYKVGGREHAEGDGGAIAREEEKRELSAGKETWGKVIAGGMRGTSKRK